MSSHAATHHDHYFVPSPSPLPFALTASLTLFVIGLIQMIEYGQSMPVLFFVGVGLSLICIYAWFWKIVTEAEGGKYNAQVDMTYRWGMGWFIFSEVMFFGAFFGALYYARALSLPWLSGEGNNLSTHLVLWPGFENTWPSNGPGDIGGSFQTIPAWDIPFINTLILLTSGVTLTIAHHALKESQRLKCILAMWATVALGAIFLFYQVEEYIHAYQDLNLTLGSGIYGSTFFMLTGFHGAHVTLGTLMLIVITLRLMKGHFTPDSHFGFEGVAWYWHFVDVVWLGLFVFVYVV
ncbi:cytochrome c oxidase subunit 3 [Algiphilus aromaticivorans]|jgi:cytochrome c oxidase subunit 3|uniref:cytochrome c oxidase subunit 3 n=1 Tax=Algiphilus aromaticivorans TaxID=382454 RepID=UPI0005C2409B|nr:cytochrome c oxidase subunit 3 [Algiphilus aromaticivorans]